MKNDALRARSMTAGSISSAAVARGRLSALRSLGSRRLALSDRIIFGKASILADSPTPHEFLAVSPEMVSCGRRMEGREAWRRSGFLAVADL